MLLPSLLLVVGGVEPVPAFPLAEDASIWDRLKLDAQGRLRGESTFDQTNDEDRHRGRFRFRFGAVYELTDTIRAGARLSTVSEGRDANNPHWDFGSGDGFSASEVGFDRVYLEWDACHALTLTGGKFAHVFTRPTLAGEFAWDDDVQPAGAAAVWKALDGGEFRLDLRSIFAVADERNAPDDASDPAVAGVQLNAWFDVNEDLDLQAAVSYSDWSSIDAAVINQGNTADAEDFAILDAWIQAMWRGGPLGAGAAFGQYLNNVDDESGEDTGFVAGGRLGAAKGKGAWNVFAAYYDLEANSVFSAVAQDDTPIAGTGNGNGEGMSGFLGGVQYFIADNLSVRLWGLTSDVDEDEDPFRVRLDFDFRIL